MHLFSSFALNRLWIGLQFLDLVDVLIVVGLKALDLALQGAQFRFLLTVNDHPVAAKRNVEKQPSGDNHNAGGRKAAALFVNPGPDGPRFFNRTGSERLRLGGTLHHRAQPIFWLGERSNFCDAIY